MNAAVVEVDQKYYLEQEALEIRKELKTVVIKDQETYLATARLVTRSADARKKIQAYWKPLKDAAFQSHKALVAAEAKMIADLVGDEEPARRAVTNWEIEQERIRQAEIRRQLEEARRRAEEEERRVAAENARIMEEQRRIAEEERLRTAVEVEQAGATEAEIEQVLSAPLRPPVVPMARPVMMVPVAPAVPAFQRAAGISKPRDNWSAEITDKVALIKYVAEHPEFSGLLDANTTALNQQARSLKSDLRIPGVRAVNNPNIAARASR